MNCPIAGCHGSVEEGYFMCLDCAIGIGNGRRYDTFSRLFSSVRTDNIILIRCNSSRKGGTHMIEGNIDSMFPSRFLKAEDINTVTKLTIKDINSEVIGRDNKTKYIVSFEESKKSLILNKTNSKSIAEIAESPTMSDWPGHTIELYTADVNTPDGMKKGIRVKAVDLPKKE